MKHGKWQILAGLFWLIAVAADDAIACSCFMSGPPCQAAWNADSVFVGTVRSIEQMDHDEFGQPYRSVLVKFDVERGFVNAVPGPLELSTASNGAACGYSFVGGERYLVYARKTPTSRLSTSICSRTRPLDKAQEDLRYLADMPRVDAGARVFGRIHHWQRDPFEAVAVDYGPVGGLVVSVSGATATRDAVTDDHGRYEIAGLPVGEWSLSVTMPDGFSPRYVEREFELRDPRACSQHDFRISHEAGARGIVVDGAGRALAGISVDAVAAELAGHLPPAYQTPVKTNANGQFEFDRLPPGTYVFGVNLTKDVTATPARPATFLPGTALARDAARIELKPGDNKDVGVVRLPER
jgi:hypothetical protein